MTEDFKDRIRKAMANYDKRQNPQATGRKNKKPEREVVLEILSWCKKNDWSVCVINSSSVYSEKENRYLTSQAPRGYPDVSGCTNLGVGAFLEIKAPGKRSTMSDDQLFFLLEKIKRGAFAGVFDSSDLLEKTYINWEQSKDKQQFLIESLPRSTFRDKSVDDTFLFND